MPKSSHVIESKTVWLCLAVQNLQTTQFSPKVQITCLVNNSYEIWTTKHKQKNLSDYLIKKVAYDSSDDVISSQGLLAVARGYRLIDVNVKVADTFQMVLQRR